MFVNSMIHNVLLQTNDMVRGFFSDNDGFISLPYEIIAGGCVSNLSFTGDLPNIGYTRITFSAGP